MQPTKSEGTGIAMRRAWRAPALTVLAIGRETKSSHRDEPGSFERRDS
jgi:hypothetical protein